MKFPNHFFSPSRLSFFKRTVVVRPKIGFPSSTRSFLGMHPPCLGSQTRYCIGNSEYHITDKHSRRGCEEILLLAGLPWP